MEDESNISEHVEQRTNAMQLRELGIEGFHLRGDLARQNYELHNVGDTRLTPGSL